MPSAVAAHGERREARPAVGDERGARARRRRALGRARRRVRRRRRDRRAARRRRRSRAVRPARGGDDRHAALPRLEHRKPEALVEGRIREHACFREQPVAFVVVDPPGDPHSRSHLRVERRDRAAHVLGVGTVGTGDRQRHFGIMSCDRLERVHQPREVLARLERADRDDRPRPLDAGVAGGSRRGRPEWHGDDPVGLEQRSGLHRDVLGDRVDPPAARGNTPHHRTERDDSRRAELARGHERAIVDRDDRVRSRRGDLVRAVDHLGAREQLRERRPTPAPRPQRQGRGHDDPLRARREVLSPAAQDVRPDVHVPRAASAGSPSTKRPMPVRGPDEGGGVDSNPHRCDATWADVPPDQDRRRPPGSLEPLMSADAALLEVTPRRRVGEHFRDIWRYRELLSAWCARS